MTDSETMQSISSYINPNTRGLKSNYKNTAIYFKEGIAVKGRIFVRGCTR